MTTKWRLKNEVLPRSVRCHFPIIAVGPSAFGKSTQPVIEKVRDGFELLNIGRNEYRRFS